MGQSARGTNIVIPVDNTGSIEDLSYIRFVEKNKSKNGGITFIRTDQRALTLNLIYQLRQMLELELVLIAIREAH